MAKSFLKWAGGKSRLAPIISELLPEGQRLIEPFVGSGAIFLNTQFKRYLLNDINEDLINLYNHLIDNHEKLIEDCHALFTPENNQKTPFYEIRERFNQSTDSYERSCLFIYLNRHGYNGLCRYNSQGIFNVPFGYYKRINLPEQAMRDFSENTKSARFHCKDFREIFKSAKVGDVIYCDPPYVPLTESAHFTAYSGHSFGEIEQRELAALAKSSAEKGIPVLVSNHDTPFTREIYAGSQLTELEVKRHISCKGEERKPVKELLALFD